MVNIVKKMIFVILVGLAASAGAEDFRDAETLSKGEGIRMEFVSYAGFEGGVGFTAAGSAFPAVAAVSGIQLKPWLALGGITSVSPLSDFDDFPFGISIADRDNAYAFFTGLGLWFTPRHLRVVHPLIGVTLGGATLGYLEDQDGKGGLEASIEENFFYAALSAGPEVNLSRHVRFYLLAGGRFVANDGALGIPDNEAGGLDVRLGFRCFWRTVID
jgi:hypothetical protein